MNESSNRGWKNINISCKVLTDKLNVPVHWFIYFPPIFLFMIFSSFIFSFHFPAHHFSISPPPPTLFVLLKMFINVSWSSQSNWKRGERMGLKGKEQDRERLFYKEDEKEGLAQTEKEEAKGEWKQRTSTDVSGGKKKTNERQDTCIFNPEIKGQLMVNVFLQEISLNLLRYIQFIFLTKSQKYKIETHRSLSFLKTQYFWVPVLGKI